MNRGRFLELPSSGAALLSRWRAPQMCVKPLHGYLGGYLHLSTYTPLGIELPAQMPGQVVSGSTDLRTSTATTTTSRSKPDPSPARAMMPTRTRIGRRHRGHDLILERGVRPSATRVRLRMGARVRRAAAARLCTRRMSLSVITPTLGLALGLAAALLIIDVLGWRVVAAMFDRGRLVTGKRT